MIKVEPAERPWEDSEAFQESALEALRERLEERLRFELVGANELFLTEEGTPHQRVVVSLDEFGIHVQTISPREELKLTWGSAVERVLEAEAKDFPLDRARELVRQNDPLAQTALAPGEYERQASMRPDGVLR